jgi:DNA gyrase subunit A
VCDALIRLIDDPDVTIDELLEVLPGPDFPTGGIVCGRSGIRRGYTSGRGTIVLRARARIEEYKDGRFRIVITEVPFQQVRDRVEERIAELVNDGRIKGVSAMRNESDLKEPVRLVVDLKRDADPEVVLNQLYQFSPLQESVSLIFLALVDGKPRTLSVKGLLEEFLRHRETVLRRRTQHLLAKARQRKHTVEGLLLAYANLDEIIAIIRSSKTQAEAKDRLMGVQCPASMMERALGAAGFAVFQAERGAAPAYTLTPVQADAILRMTLGQLVNLEQEKLAEEHRGLLEEIADYQRILADRRNLLDIIREDLYELKKKHGEERRTEISDQEATAVDTGDLIAEATMVVTISHQGYIKRTASSTYRAQRRGGKGIKGAKAEEEDPIEHLFVASTHDYLLFFTNRGKVYWQKVYDLPELSRDSRGRALVNLLRVAEGEKVLDCLAVRDFSEPDCYLVMATAKGLVKKTALSEYGRPLRGGLIAVKLREDDELVDVVIARDGDELVLSTARGMAIRFKHSAARPMGRAASGVKGIKLRAGDRLVGMVVADPEASLLTVCENGYGKRTLFGPNDAAAGDAAAGDVAAGEVAAGDETAGDDAAEGAADEPEAPAAEGHEPAEGGEESADSQRRYRAQNRGGFGLRDIKTSDRNGEVVCIESVRDDDELLMISANGKMQRIRAADISVIGRNTQGVKIMGLDEGDKLAVVVRIAREERNGDGLEVDEPPADESSSGGPMAPDEPSPGGQAGT